MKIPLRYLAKRVFNLIAVVWFAATVNFLVPRMTTYNPVLEYLLETTTQSGNRSDQIQSLLEFYTDWAGLNQSVWR